MEKTTKIYVKGREKREKKIGKAGVDDKDVRHASICIMHDMVLFLALVCVVGLSAEPGSLDKELSSLDVVVKYGNCQSRISQQTK